MKIAFGTDHAGFSHRAAIIGYLHNSGHQVTDFGSPAKESCDYPDLGEAVASAVARGECERGILMCGTGIGMSIVANKVRGVRAAVCWNDETAGLVSEHNDANVLCLPGRFATTDQMVRWISVWLATPASADERHRRRREKVALLEKKMYGGK